MKIGIVNTSKEMRERLVKILNREHWKICCHAENEVEAFMECGMCQPDLILIDVNILGKDGLGIIQKLTKKWTCAIVITTTNIKENASLVFEAMGHGALDVIKIPEHNQNEIHTFIKKIEQCEILLGKAPSKIKDQCRSTNLSKSAYTEEMLPPLILMGASTGGPLALAKILSTFPKNSNASIIIIQHVDEQFARGFAEWLQQHTKLKVCLVTNDVRPEAGVVFVAGTNDHLIITPDLRLKYTEVPLDAIHRPSIDVLFNSAAKEWPEKSIAVLLTGMGKDGAKGLKALRDAGWKTYAQEEESCVIYSMPKAALENDAVEKALCLEEISKEILAILKEKQQTNPWRRQ